MAEHWCTAQNLPIHMEMHGTILNTLSINSPPPPELPQTHLNLDNDSNILKSC
jgi:hypothetical protein